MKIFKGILVILLSAGLLAAVSTAQTTTGNKAPASKTPATTAAPAAKSATSSATPKAADLIDINTASKADLMKLPGITDADAAKIIAARPYKNKTQLKSTKAVSDAEYDKIADMVIAKQAPKGK